MGGQQVAELAMSRVTHGHGPSLIMGIRRCIYSIFGVLAVHVALVDMTWWSRSAGFVVGGQQVQGWGWQGTPLGSS